MKFSIGDKVVFKHTDGEGVVCGIINDKMVEVEMDGVAFPVHTDEIDHPYLKWFTQKKQQPQKKVVDDWEMEKPKQRVQRVAKGIYLSFMPEYKLVEMEDVVDCLKVHLLNELPREVHFKYEVMLNNKLSFNHEGSLHAFGHVYLHSVPYDSMNDQPRFNWVLDDRDDGNMAPASGQLRIRPQKLFQHIDECLSKNEPSFNYLLIEDFQAVLPGKKQPSKTNPESYRDQKLIPSVIGPKAPARPPQADQSGRQNQKSQSTLPDTEIDLHIENLVSSTRGMSNTDIMMVQLSALQSHIRRVINSRQERLMIIHGLGKGKLKDEVHRILAETPEVKSYTNEWQGRYGFGATEVWFKY